MNKIEKGGFDYLDKMKNREQKKIKPFFTSLTI